MDEQWYKFLKAVEAEFGDGWWTAHEALYRIPLGSLPLDVQVSLQRGASSSKSLGKMLGARRGLCRELDLSSDRTNKHALHWKVESLL